MSDQSVLPRTTQVFAVLSLALGILACDGPVVQNDGQENRQASDVLEIYTVNYPLAYFAERIAGDAARVTFPAPDLQDPAYWRPEAETIGAYQRADLILLNGAGYAAWVQQATLPAGRIINTSEALTDRYIRIDEGVTHTHGPDGDHSHGVMAFTTWLDPEIAIAQARSIMDRLIELRPDRETEFQAAFAAVESELNTLDEGFAQVFRELSGQTILFSHPVYQYLAHRYDVDGTALHWEPDRDPDDAEWRRLGKILRANPARLMVWEAEPTTYTRDRLSGMGVDVVVFETAANRPTEGDFLDTMRRNRAALEAIAGSAPAS